MSIECFYSATGKYYRTPKGLVVPSAGTACTLITKESYDFVGIQTLERAIQQGEGAHEVACNYSLYVLGHSGHIHPFPPMPAGHPDTKENWDRAMGHAQDQVVELFAKYEVEPIAIEEPSICSAYFFGGQPDIKLWMKWRNKRIIAVWDYKRVAALALANYLKIEAYLMLDGFTDCSAGFLAWLKKDAPPQLVHCPRNGHYKAAIMGAAGLLNFQIANRILKP